VLAGLEELMASASGGADAARIGESMTRLEVLVKENDRE
jgi:hypothetical protein